MSTQKRERKAQDPEITVLKACMRQLDTLSFVARVRVARYLADYASDLKQLGKGVELRGPFAPEETPANGPAQQDPFE